MNNKTFESSIYLTKQYIEKIIVHICGVKDFAIMFQCYIVTLLCRNLNSCLTNSFGTQIYEEADTKLEEEKLACMC